MCTKPISHISTLMKGQHTINSHNWEISSSVSVWYSHSKLLLKLLYSVKWTIFIWSSSVLFFILYYLSTDELLWCWDKKKTTMIVWKLYLQQKCFLLTALILWVTINANFSAHLPLFVKVKSKACKNQGEKRHKDCYGHRATVCTMRWIWQVITFRHVQTCGRRK